LGITSLPPAFIRLNFLRKQKWIPISRFGYRLERNSMINPFTLQAGFESGETYQKTSLELNYRLSYYEPDNGLDIRLFAGTMLKENSEIPFYSFSPGGRSGRELYLFEGTLPRPFCRFSNQFLVAANEPFRRRFGVAGERQPGLQPLAGFPFIYKQFARQNQLVARETFCQFAFKR
jgi:hypothetical protein